MSEPPFEFTFTYSMPDVASDPGLSDDSEAASYGPLPFQDDEGSVYAGLPSPSSYASFGSIHSPRRPTRTTYWALGGALGRVPTPPPNLHANHTPAHAITQPAIPGHDGLLSLPDSTAEVSLARVPSPPPSLLQGPRAATGTVPQWLGYMPDYPVNAPTLNYSQVYKGADAYHSALLASIVAYKRRKREGSAPAENPLKREVERSANENSPRRRRCIRDLKEELIYFRYAFYSRYAYNGILCQEGLTEINNRFVIPQKTTKSNNKPKMCIVCIMHAPRRLRDGREVHTFDNSVKVHVAAKRHRQAVGDYLGLKVIPGSQVVHRCGKPFCDFVSDRKDTVEDHRASVKCDRERNKNRLAAEAREADARAAAAAAIEQFNLVQSLQLQLHSVPQESHYSPVGMSPAMSATTSSSSLPSLSPEPSSSSTYSSSTSSGSRLQTPEAPGLAFTDDSSAILAMPKRRPTARALVQDGRKATYSDLVHFGNMAL